MDNSQCLRLINLYRDYKCLWDSNDEDYTDTGVREDVWQKISCEIKLVAELKKNLNKKKMSSIFQPVFYIAFSYSTVFFVFVIFVVNILVKYRLLLLRQFFTVNARLTP